MARRKKRFQEPIPGKNQNAVARGVGKTNPMDRTPKSMVIRMGASDVGPSVTQLVKDVRQVMEPHTASRLRERRSNKLRDYTTMAGPLGVTHLLLFSRSPSGNTNFRLAIAPRGPTLTFRVEKYSLNKDIVKALKHAKSGGGLSHLNPPLLVMNNFASPLSAQPTTDSPSTIPKHLEALVTSTFQSLFPPISPQHTPLTSIRRVLLLDRDTPDTPSADGTFTLSFRHYAISSKVVVPISKGIKRLRHAERALRTSKPTTPLDDRPARRKHGLPNLSKLDDVADYVLNAGGYTSASESEVDTDAEVEVLESSTRRVLSRREHLRQREANAAAAARADAMAVDEAEPEADGDKEMLDEDDEDNDGANGDAAAARGRYRPPSQKRAIKLTELGPRMRLRLVKLEDGLCTGKVMWHEFVSKSREEEKAQDALWEQRRVEREERRRVQRENVERKRAEAKARRGDGVEENGEGGEEEGEEDEEMDFDDDEWMDEFDGDGGGVELSAEREGEDEEVEEEEEDEEEEE